MEAPQLDASTDSAPTDAAPLDAPSAAIPPLHVFAETIVDGATDVVLGGVSATIDTTNLTINGATSRYFVRQAPYAILFVDALAVQVPLTIIGTAPLIVVARDRITIDSNIDLHAIGATPGPGAQTSGAGAGGPGASFLVPQVNERESSGGGGGSYGSLGGPGGTSDPTRIPAGASGARYGGRATDPLFGGSPGGPGGFADSGGGGGGGGGGGALQLSSARSIRVSATINAGGGGGSGTFDVGRVMNDSWSASGRFQQGRPGARRRRCS